MVVIHQLPQTPETLWLRLLGREGTQQRAIQEVLALSLNHPKRSEALQLLVSWKIMLEVHPSQEDQEMLMLLSQVYQEWEQVTKDQGRQQGRQEEGRSLILRLLSRKFGTIDTALHAQIDQLSLEQLEALGEALLDFTNPSDLDDWLQLNCA